VASLHADDERRDKASDILDPERVQSVQEIWQSTAQLATIGIFVLLLGACFYVCRPILLPVLSALLVGMTLAPLVKLAKRRGIPTAVTAIFIVLVLLAIAAGGATLVAAPLTEWIGRAPEIGANIKQKFYVLDRPLAALNELRETLLPAGSNAVTVEPPQLSLVTPVLSFVTPAVTESMVFLVTLILFLAGQVEFRRYMASFFESREAKLRFLRIANEIEHDLAVYVATMTAINVALGVIVAIGAWLLGLPSPLVLGLIAGLLNYVPYIGPACVAVMLLGVGLVTFPGLGQALIPPAAFVGLATLEGQFITPTVLGHNLTLSPLSIFLALAFWAWLWGPMGAFLAVPISIIGLVVTSHLFPPDDIKLPE
jgi:predicted PurR-regulated permease PerM